MAKKRIFILGAGLAGLSAAWHLQKEGVECSVFEKEPEVGGLCRSKKINGFTFDYDGHLLYFKHHYTFGLVRKLLGNNLVKHDRSSWIYAFNTFIRYPFQANLYGLPPSVVKECLLGFIHRHKNGHFKKKNNQTFLDWINQTFGRGIARHFMIPYNTKFWMLPPHQLTCEWLDGFIPVPSLDQIIEGTVEESQRQFGYNAQFWYPKEGGIAQLPLALAREVRNIYTSSQVTEINIRKKEITINAVVKEQFDYLISTIPLPEMAHLIKGLPSGVKSSLNKLKWNSIFNLNLGIENKNNSKRHWIYFPQKEICFFRTGFYHNFSPHLAPTNKNSLYIEVSHSKNQPIEKSKIIARIKEDLKKVGLLTQDAGICAQDINEIKYAYPIYDKDYNAGRQTIVRFLLRNRIIPCGRYGSWRYMSMEGALLDGKYAAEVKL